MAVTFVAAGGGSGGSSGITPALPTGIEPDDILILVCESAGTEAVSTPTDWTLLDQAYETGDVATGTRLTVFWKRVVGGESAPSVADPGDHVVGRIAAYRGCHHTGNPFDVVTGGVDSSAGTSVSITGVTTTVANCLVLNMIAMPPDTNTADRITNWTNGNLTSVTERFDNFSTASNGGGIGMVEGYKATAGSTGATTATLATSEVAAFMTVALKPPSPSISQVGSATSDTSALGTDVTVTKPTGVQSGDVLIAFGCTTESTPFFDTVPSGFTEFASSADGDTGGLFRAIGWYKVCGGSEPSNYTFGSGGAEGAGAPLVVTMTAWRGVDNTTPVPQVSEIATSTSAEPSDPATTFSQGGAGRILFMRAARSTTAIPTFSQSTVGWSELVDDGDFSGSSVRYGMAVFALTEDTAAGTRNEPPVTCGTTETDNVFMLLRLALAAVAETADAEAVTAASTANAAGAKLGALSGSVAPSVTANASTARTGIGAASPSNTAAATVDKPTPGVKTRAESIG